MRTQDCVMPARVEISKRPSAPSHARPLTVGWLLVGWGLLLGAAEAPSMASYGDSPRAAGNPSAASRTQKDSKTKAQKSDNKARTNPDAALVRKHLEKYLHPTKIKFLKGGRVKLLFSFGEKNENHE